MKSRFLKSIVQTKNKSKLGRILILTGARQTGKTTLAKESFPQYHYLSIEDPRVRSDYLKLSADQWKSVYPHAILDEIQKEPQLVESIKSVYDQFKTPRYLLLGSSQILLLKKVKESLAGRCLIYETWPLTLPEILTDSWNSNPQNSFFQNFCNTFQLPDLLPSFKLYKKHANSIKALQHYLRWGGYPVLTDNELNDNERKEWLNNYIRTYLERDIRDLADIKDLNPFVKIQRISALLTACTLNYSQLARETGVSSNTARRFLNYLELSYQAFLLKPWYKKNLKRLNKSPKLHYLDPGVQRAILKKEGDMHGNEYESAIIAEIYKQSQYINPDCELYHLRTFDGREIDLLIEFENGYIAIEIKMSNNVTKTDARHLNKIDEMLYKPLIHSFIISNDMDIKTLTNNITAIPAAMFLT